MGRTELVTWVPDMGLTPSRFLQLGCRYRSRSPYRFPVLRRGLHHNFLDPLFDEPFRQPSQMVRGVPNWRLANSSSPSTSTSVTTTTNIFYYVRQFPPSCFLLAGEESVPQVPLTRVAGYRRSHRRERQRPIICSTRHAPDQTVTRPRLFTVESILPLPAFPILLDSEPFS
jgi:hypothetical protein